MRTVRRPACPNATARLSAMVVVPTPPLGANTVKMREPPCALASRCAVWTACTLLIRS
jgi:hypothetical protein